MNTLSIEYQPHLFNDAKLFRIYNTNFIKLKLNLKPKPYSKLKT